jgi:hypothetical protein
MNINEFCIKNPTISALDQHTIERMHQGVEKEESEWFEILKDDFISVLELFKKQGESNKQKLKNNK